ncbi:hypothetical protein [Aquimarina sp. 2304DJ70-9]|uniref:hypothetical protein n=1 Tax=Aquimarina penaris TaxID=3231044 RepID=UPI003462904E
MFSANIYAQKSVNDYKYVVVPAGYSFFNDKDAYQLNSLTKFLFNKYGFNAFKVGDDFPEDLKNNGCKKLLADIKKGNGLFVTKLIIELTDCNGVVVYSSSEGTSREKEYRKAYQEALRGAFKDVEKLGYKYNGSQEVRTAAAAVPLEKKDKPSDRVEATKEEQPVSTAPSENTLSYTLNDQSFVLEKQEYGYELLQKQNDKLISLGKIYKMTRDNSYLVSAKDLSGGGHFDGFGNFILERINPATNKLITDTLARQ